MAEQLVNPWAQKRARPTPAPAPAPQPRTPITVPAPQHNVRLANEVAPTTTLTIEAPRVRPPVEGRKAGTGGLEGRPLTEGSVSREIRVPVSIDAKIREQATTRACSYGVIVAEALAAHFSVPVPVVERKPSGLKPFVKGDPRASEIGKRNLGVKRPRKPKAP